MDEKSSGESDVTIAQDEYRPLSILHVCGYFQTSTLYHFLFEKLHQSFAVKQQVFTVVQERAYVAINPDLQVPYKLRVYGTLKQLHRMFYGFKVRSVYNSFLASDLLSNKTDLLHAHTLFSDGAVARRVSLKTGIPYVVAIRNTDLNVFLRYKPYLWFLAQRILLDSQAIICISPAMKVAITARFPNPELLKKIQVIPNGISDYWHDHRALGSEFINREVNSNKFKSKGDKAFYKALFVGRINENKNLANLIKSLSKVRDDGYEVTLDIFGNKEHSSVELDKALKLPFVKVYPYVTNTSDLLKVFRQADLFVMPSIFETFGLVYAEALSQGLPVLFSKKQGFDGWFPDGFCGVAVNPHSVPDIAEGIKKILQNYSTMQINTIDCSKQFNWRTVAQDYYDVYQRSITIK